jgi:DNA adenine methylase
LKTKPKITVGNQSQTDWWNDRQAVRRYAINLVTDGTLSIDSDGRIWRHFNRIKFGRVAIPLKRAENRTRKGYLVITFRIQGTKITRSVLAHILVWSVLHGNLINLAWVLQDKLAAVELYDRLMRTLFCEELLESSKEIFSKCFEFLRTKEIVNRSKIGFAIPDERIEIAYWFFVHSWCARNGTSGSKRMNFQLAVRWTAGGGSPTTRFRNAIESIPAWHERLRNVVILNRDAFEVLPSIPDEKGVAVYCDPPYLHSTRSGDGDGGYLHDFEELPGFLAHQDCHAKLADELGRFHNARIIVSYYDHPSLESLYPPDRWTKVDCAMNKNLHVQNRRGTSDKKTAPEVLLINGPSFTAKQFLLF